MVLKWLFYFGVQQLSCVQLFATPQTLACQAPLCGISQAKILEWVAILFSGGGDGNLPNPGVKPMSTAWQADSKPLSHLGSPLISGPKFNLSKKFSD